MKRFNHILTAVAISAVALGFTACVNEEDDIFPKSAAERLNEVKDVYGERLTAAEGGWAMQYFPHDDEEEGGYGLHGYLLLAKFRTNGTVKMAMSNIMVPYYFGTGQTYGEDDNSLWEVISDNGPVLSFNTFNKCIHAFSDPEDLPFTGTSSNRVNEQGTGMNGDYEFVIVDAPADGGQIVLKGKKRGTYSYLTQLPDDTDFQAYVSDINEFEDKMFSSAMSNYLNMNLGENAYVLGSTYSHYSSYYPVGEDSVSTSKYNPLVVIKHDGKYKIRFRDAMTASDESTVQVFDYDATQDKFIGEGNEACVISPMLPGACLERVLSNGGMLSLSPTQTDRMSEKMQKLMGDMVSAYSAFRRGGLFLSKTDGEYMWSIFITSYFDYIYDTTISEDGTEIDFSYREPANSRSELRYNAKEEVRNLINAMSQGFTISSASDSNFDMRYIRFTSKSDPELWFDLAV